MKHIHPHAAFARHEAVSGNVNGGIAEEEGDRPGKRCNQEDVVS